MNDTPSVRSSANPAAGALLAGQMAIVTGASRGIGRAIALSLARAGAAVALAARSAGALERLANDIEAQGGRAVAIPTDLTRDSDLPALVETVVTELGGLSILVNNAGMGVYGAVEHTTNAQWDAIMTVNARAPFILCREAIPHLRASGRGTIVNLSSVVGVKGYINQGAYTASKHALMGLSKVLAQEVQADGIRVHTICPGAVDTDMATQARPDLDRACVIRPAEIAEIVLFLLTHRGNAVIDDVHVRRASGAPWF
ncbi:MAG: SDR family oxidoreductase [bacterium]|nr:SDR family oxidoreductase [bacterium]